MHSVSMYSTLIIVPTVALAGLFWAARREGGRPIAQVLAPVIGAIIGVCGVFLVTQLQFAHQTEQLQEDARAKFSPAMSKWREHDASQTELRPYLGLRPSVRGAIGFARAQPIYDPRSGSIG